MAQPRRTRPAKRSSMPHLAGIGTVVADRRRELNLTQQALADLSGVSRSSVQELEYGNGAVRLESLLAITDVLGLRLTMTRAGND